MTATIDLNTMRKVSYRLDSLSLYRKLLADPILSAMNALLHAVTAEPVPAPEVFIALYAGFIQTVSGKNPEIRFDRAVFEAVLLDENAFTKKTSSHTETAETPLKAAALSDLQALRGASRLTSRQIKELYLYRISANYPQKEEGLGNAYGSDPAAEVIAALPDWASGPINSSKPKDPDAESLWTLWASDALSEQVLDRLAAYHHAYGYGNFMKHHAYVWRHNGSNNAGASGREGHLEPVVNPDPVRLSDLIAYESEREEVVRNTEQFLQGYAANNVLLYGDRGTGKSSTVKALLNEYAGQGLRMIEVPKLSLADFPQIIGMLAEKPYKFILFIDDLAFEDNEDNYTAMKAIIEGGLELRPKNVLIYATSNRKHLVKEKFSDRVGLQFGSQEDEVRSIDTLQEKLSLSDRFGITVVFSSPDKKRFLQIVEALALKKGIFIDSETLHREALKWELWYNGRSPRTAQQFISWLEGSRR